MRILLLEDEMEIAKFILIALRHEGYSVDHTTSGKKAVFLALTNDYDLIISDLMLPDINGFEVCEAIRKEKPDVPILMLTVMEETKDKVKAFNLGADDYLTKPFAVDELLVRIKALMRRPAIIKSDVLKVGQLILDAKAHTVTYQGKLLDLRIKEYSLLEYMMRNESTVLSRSMMLEHVWDMNIDPFTNTVDVHIRSLRHKLNDEDGRIIKTVHGFGYKIGD